MIDTHCHLNFERFNEDRDAVVKRAQDAGVKRIIIPAIDVATTPDVLACIQRYEGVYGAVGIHPNSTADFDNAMLAYVKEHANHERVVAIGEIGLDYHWDFSPKEKQIPAFEAQLDLAQQLALPVIIHNREASDDVISILEQWAKPLPEGLRERPGVLHSFSAPRSIAERALEAGFYLGFTGPITFKKAQYLRDIVRDVPLERILVETDAPFLTPHPYRGKRNEPAYIPYMVEKIAEVKGLDVNTVAEATTRNGERLFGLEGTS
jgi:TatD DNase family protein